MNLFDEARRIEFELEIGLQIENFISFQESIIKYKDSFENLLLTNIKNELYLQQTQRRDT